MVGRTPGRSFVLKIAALLPIGRAYGTCLVRFVPHEASEENVSGMRRSMWALFLTLFLAVTMAAGVTNAASASPPDGVLESYIVVLEPGTTQVPDVAAALAQAHAGQVGFVYEHALQGFSMTMSPRAAAALARNPQVAYVETNDTVTIADHATPTGVQRIFADSNTGIDIDAVDDYRVDVDVAVIDTGVDFEHPDLDVVGGVTCSESGGGPPWARSASCSSGGDDDHYHGTHVAGTIGAIDNGVGVVGVAPGARIWAVKVLDSGGSGSEAMVVAGIDWVAANADIIEVANMSLGGSGFSQAEYDAIEGAVDAGVAFAVAAGNSGADANNYSPAAFDNVLTVSALADFDGTAGGGAAATCRSDQDDTLADFSNWGSAVDIAAPGVCIRSTYPIEQGGYGTISGTSMASPHAAGALALLASVDNPTTAADVDSLYSAVIGSGNDIWIDDSGDGVKEPLLDVSSFAASLVATDGGGPDNPPTVTITSPGDGASITSGESITFAGSASDVEDGTVTGSLVWTSSNDGQIGTGASFTTSALSNGTHTITASANDSAGNTGSATITVTVEASGGTGITLTLAGAYKIRGVQTADLAWTGATTTNVDLYRNGMKLGTTENDGTTTDSTGQKGGGSVTYRICEAGSTTICSNEVLAAW